MPHPKLKDPKFGDDGADEDRHRLPHRDVLCRDRDFKQASVVKLTTYVTDMSYRIDLAPIREEFFGKKGPASTLVEISALAHPDWMIEIEAIAVV